MFSKAEAVRLKKEFWTVFGKYMTPVLSADGEKINWVNYHTGFKNFYFRMDASSKSASISIELTNPDKELRNLFYDRLTELKKILEDHLGEKWNWEQFYVDEYGKEMARIYVQITDVNVFLQDDWPAIISFLKPRIIKLDHFWSEAKYAFEEFR